MKKLKAPLTALLIVGFVISAFTQTTTITTIVPPYPGDVTKFLNGIGQFSVPAGGGGGGDTLWHAYTAPDSEGGTIYGTASTNALLPNIVNFAVRYDTNTLNDFTTVFAVGYPTNDVSTLVSNNFGVLVIGDGAIQGSIVYASTDTTAIAGHSLYSSTVTLSSSTLAMGPYALGNSAIVSNSTATLALGSYALNHSKVLHSSDVTALANSSLANSTITESQNISALLGRSLDHSTVNTCYDVTGIAGTALYNSTFLNSGDIIGLNDFALGFAYVTNSTDLTAMSANSLGGSVLDGCSIITALNGGLQNALLTNSSEVFAINNAGNGLTGTFTDVLLLGDGATLPSGSAHIAQFGSAIKVVAPMGFSSLATDAAVTISATGWTNSFGKAAVVDFDGTAVTWVKYNNAGTPIHTNAVSVGSGEIILQTGGKVIFAAGAGITGNASPF